MTAVQGKYAAIDMKGLQPVQAAEMRSRASSGHGQLLAASEAGAILSNPGARADAGPTCRPRGWTWAATKARARTAMFLQASKGPGSWVCSDRPAAGGVAGAYGGDQVSTRGAAPSKAPTDSPPYAGGPTEKKLYRAAEDPRMAREDLAEAGGWRVVGFRAVHACALSMDSNQIATPPTRREALPAEE